MLKNTKGDIAILFSLAVSSLILGYIGILQLISSNQLRMSLSSLQKLTNYPLNEVYAWRGYLSKQATDAGVSIPIQLTPPATIAGGKTEVTPTNSKVYCGSAGNGATLCIRPSSSGGNTNLPPAGPPAPEGDWQTTTLNAAIKIGNQTSLLWTGSKLISWAGTNYNGGFISTGYIYDPETLVWTPIAQDSNTPVGIYYPILVWTGTQLIAWGSRSQSDPPNTGPYNYGAMYNPSTQMWSPMSRPPISSAVNQNSVGYWTGSKMLVMYGNQGYLYNPKSNNWSTTAPFPSELNGKFDWATLQTAIYGWSGTKLMIWGGFDQNSTPNQTGAIYDSITNTWQVMSVGPNTPIGRTNASVVWTGTHFIVWGGSDRSWFNEVNTGGLYDPANDSWSPINTLNAPEGRIGHAAVWTGKRMFVYGGQSREVNSGQTFTTGGLYDPITQIWTPTTINPSAPYMTWITGFAWTGKKVFMVVNGSAQWGLYEYIPK